MDIHAAIGSGDGPGVLRFIESGGDINQTGHSGTTPLMTAVRQKNQSLFDILLTHGADPDLTDGFNHTALHTAVESDWPQAVERLIKTGMDLGRNPKYPLKKIDYSFERPIGQLQMPEEMRGVMDEEEWVRLSAEAVGSLNEIGANPEPEPVISGAVSIQVLKILLEAGEDLVDADAEMRREYIGLPPSAPLDIGRPDYERDRLPRDGVTNPERIDSPFMEAMVRCGASAFVARQEFGDEDRSHPVWSYDRFGHSLNELPDGRFVGIAGEHEDYYDPDFFIYSDVVVHDGRGGIEIYGYPRAVFPGTDFHSATLVDNAIVVIGSLGYPGDRRIGATPVYGLDLSSMEISAVQSTGCGPGWISRHKAHLQKGRRVIRVEGGEVWASVDGDEAPDLHPNEEIFELDLDSSTWSKVR